MGLLYFFFFFIRACEKFLLQEYGFVTGCCAAECSGKVEALLTYLRDGVA